ncbi:hypothetical protein [Streptomyces sp. NPDC002559]
MENRFRSLLDACDRQGIIGSQMANGDWQFRRRGMRVALGPTPETARELHDMVMALRRIGLNFPE